MTLDEVARRLETASETLAGAHGVFEQISPAARAFGADAPGQLGALGRQLFAGWCAAVLTREREAKDHAARLVETAQGVRLAAHGYRGTEDDLRAAQDRVGGTP